MKNQVTLFNHQRYSANYMKFFAVTKMVSMYSKAFLEMKQLALSELSCSCSLFTLAMTQDIGNSIVHTLYLILYLLCTGKPAQRGAGGDMPYSLPTPTQIMTKHIQFSPFYRSKSNFFTPLKKCDFYPTVSKFYNFHL